MSTRTKLSVAGVVATIERELQGGPGESEPAPVRGGIDLERLRAAQREFRAEPVGGRLRGLKRLAFWFVASAFDRQGKVVEALFDELESAEAARDRLERKLAALEARVGTSSGEAGR